MSLHNALQIEYLSPELIQNHHRQLRTFGKNQIRKAENLIRECGILPVAIDGDNRVVTGAHLVEAARRLKLEEIPVIRVSHLTAAQIQTLRIAHDRIAEEGVWNHEALAEEFRDLLLKLPDFDLALTGFEVPEIDSILNPIEDDADEGLTAWDEGNATTKLGDIYILGDHRLYCGDATKPESYQFLMGAEKAQVAFTDAPYNVKIDGHVCNSGKIKHREFLEGAGEMTSSRFTEFLGKAHKLMADYSQEGAILFSCMDWRHMMEISAAGSMARLALQNLCVWVKDNGGMGSLYRSRHELVFVFKKEGAKHINNIQLGKHGRYRTNVWEYPGVNSFGSGRMDELAMHPTVKPQALVADAIKDCSTRGGIVLDPFGGSGTTLVAAEKTSRKARLIELDPLYCDVIIRRWQKMTGKDAINGATGQTFNEVASAGGING